MVTVLPTHCVNGVNVDATEGNGYTVTVLDVVHPPAVYVILVVPAPAPVTTPVELPTVAIAAFPLDQVPPAVRSLSVVLASTHTFVVPVIACGDCDRLPKFVPDEPVVIAPVAILVKPVLYIYPFAENEPSDEELVARTCSPAMVIASALFLFVPFIVKTRLLLVSTPLALEAFLPFLTV
jgi:hypothetical protein